MFHLTLGTVSLPDNVCQERATPVNQTSIVTKKSEYFNNLEFCVMSRTYDLTFIVQRDKYPTISRHGTRDLVLDFKLFSADNPCPVMTSCDDGHQLQQIVCTVFKLDID
jgi:hypothetical protein